MRAAWYEHQGPAGDVLEVGELPTPAPGAGEVRLKVAVSGINPGDLKKREDFFGYGMAYPLVIPHSDGAGVIDQLGEGVDEEWLGRRVWCYGAQSYRPFGTAAEYTVLPLDSSKSRRFLTAFPPNRVLASASLPSPRTGRSTSPGRWRGVRCWCRVGRAL